MSQDEELSEAMDSLHTALFSCNDALDVLSSEHDLHLQSVEVSEIGRQKHLTFHFYRPHDIKDYAVTSSGFDV